MSSCNDQVAEGPGGKDVSPDETTAAHGNGVESGTEDACTGETWEEATEAIADLAWFASASASTEEGGTVSSETVVLPVSETIEATEMRPVEIRAGLQAEDKGAETYSVSDPSTPRASLPSTSHRKPTFATSSLGKMESTKRPAATASSLVPTRAHSFGEQSSSMTRQIFRSPPSRSNSATSRRRLPVKNRSADFDAASLSPTLSTAVSTDMWTDVKSNPIQRDPELKAMVEEQLAAVHSYRSFKLWRSSFLNRFDAFLTQEGAPQAKKAYTDFGGSVQRFVQYVHQLQANLERGDLTVDRTTVRGRNSLNEMNKALVQVMEQEQALIPARGRDEKSLGYTKFHLGAVLVRDGFRDHDHLRSCSEILTNLKDTTDLKHIADRQQIDEICNLAKQLGRFRDIMYDLGLLEVMLKSTQYGDPEEELIFVDLKTGALGAVTVASCLEHGVLHRTAKGGNSLFQEAMTDEDDRQAVLDLVEEIFTSKDL